MHFSKRLSALALSLFLVPIAAQALSLQDGAEPAEFPPANYTADVYVDSRGCVYIRAGFSGAVTWVPRVTRSREVVCGQQPSLGGGTRVAQAPASAAPTAQTPEPIPAPAAVPVAAAATEPTPAPAVARTPVAPAIPEPAPGADVTRTVTLTCPSGGAHRNVRADGVSVPLRCEADQAGTITYIVAHRNGDRTRVIVDPAPPLRAPVQMAAVAGAPISVPEGYRPAWNDGRLNPNRGPRSAMGDAQMGLLWTQTVPRKMIDTATGR